MSLVKLTGMKLSKFASLKALILPPCLSPYLTKKLILFCLNWLHQLKLIGPGQVDIKILMMSGYGLMGARLHISIGSQENQMMQVKTKITSYSIMEEHRAFGLMILQQNFNVHPFASMTPKFEKVMWCFICSLYTLEHYHVSKNFASPELVFKCAL